MLDNEPLFDNSAILNDPELAQILTEVEAAG